MNLLVVDLSEVLVLLEASTLMIKLTSRVGISTQGLQPASHSQRCEIGQHLTECKTGGQDCWFWFVQGFQSWWQSSSHCYHRWYSRIFGSRVCQSNALQQILLFSHFVSLLLLDKLIHKPNIYIGIMQQVNRHQRVMYIALVWCC